MAKERPSLTVQAQPVSTFVSPGNVSAAGVELYDQQTVNLALQFADAFSGLSLSAAKLAGTLKQESNEEELKKGQDLVNSSQKSYKQLVETGQIKPTENPWMAVGAQSASGTVEGMKARAHFLSLYNKRKEEDPSFLDGPEGFSAMASQYTTNVNTMIGNAPYMSRSFYESFNPFIASMAVQHEDNMVKRREERVSEGVSASVAQAMDDLNSPNQTIREQAVTALQDALTMQSNMGFSQTRINRYATDFLIQQAAKGEDPETALRLLDEFPAGTGPLGNTSYAKAQRTQYSAAIAANRDKLTRAKSEAINKEVSALSGQILSGTLSQEEANTKFDSLLTGDNPKYRVSAQEMESKLGWASNEFKSATITRQKQILSQNKEYIAKLTEGLANGTSGMFDDIAGPEYENAATDAVVTQAKALGFSTEEAVEYGNRARQAVKQGNERRQEQMARIREETMWTGDGFSVGVLPTARAQMNNFLMNGELPNWVDSMAPLRSSREEAGMTFDGDKMKARLLQDYSRIDAEVFTPYEQDVAKNGLPIVINGREERIPFGGSIQPLPNDSPEIRSRKADFRARMGYLRISLGQETGDSREAQRIYRKILPALTTVAAETDPNMTSAEDALSTVFMARANGIPAESLMESPNAANNKEVRNLLGIMEDEYRGGKQLPDIIRDAAAARVMAPQMRTGSDVDWRNPYRYVEWDSGTGKDAQMYQDRFVAFRQDAGLTQSDAVLYLNSQMSRYVRDGLAGDHIGNMRKAIDVAETRLLQDHIVFRGSVIPKKGLNPAIDSNFIAAWMESQGFPEGTTLVPVFPKNDGTAMLAPRDKDGRAVGNALINSTDFNSFKVDPKILKFTIQREAELKKSRETGKPESFTEMTW